MKYIFFDEGRINVQADGTYQYEYFLKDHLGNTRATFAVINNAAVEQQENAYYPFGMSILQLAYNATTTNVVNKYLYNGKEMQDDFGLDWLDYGARMYDASVGRWWTVDPMAEKYRSINPYNYCLNNPVAFVDPNGMETYTGDQAVEVFTMLKEMYPSSSTSNNTSENSSAPSNDSSNQEQSGPGDPPGALPVAKNDAIQVQKPIVFKNGLPKLKTVSDWDEFWIPNCNRKCEYEGADGLKELGANIWNSDFVRIFVPDVITADITIISAKPWCVTKGGKTFTLNIITRGKDAGDIEFTTTTWKSWGANFSYGVNFGGMWATDLKTFSKSSLFGPARTIGGDVFGGLNINAGYDNWKLPISKPSIVGYSYGFGLAVGVVGAYGTTK